MLESASTLTETLYVPGTVGKVRPSGWTPSWVVRTTLYALAERRFEDVKRVNLMF